MYGGWDWPPYESVTERKRKAEKTIVNMEKKGRKLFPVRIEGRKITKSFWGNAWCKHLESFSDYATRLPRGRSYARHGSVINLESKNGEIEALVQGSEIYDVSITIQKVEQQKWQVILKKCAGEIASIIELLQGKISSAVMTTMTDKQNGLFPSPKEISFKCSCYDFAKMCKHIAAVLYGIGARLDHEPELLFNLRNVNHMELITNVAISTSSTGTIKTKVIESQDLSTLFGIELDTPSSPHSKIKLKANTEAKSKGVFKKKPHPQKQEWKQK